MIYPSDRAHLFTIYSWSAIMLIFLIGGFAEGQGIMMKSYLGVSWVVYTALGKALSTLIKYYMQAHHNYMRKAVTGASPLSFAVDLTAVVLAFV
jgi:hypothetical protein